MDSGENSLLIMPIRGIKRNFTGGEVAQTISSRDDLAKYQASCAKMTNFVAQLHGGARYREGFRFIDEALGQAVLIPFEFNTDEEDMYVLVFTDLKLRIIQDDGYVLNVTTPVEVVTPYTATELPQIRYAQSGDVMYLVHPNHPPQKLVRTSHTSWTLSAVSFTSSIDAPASPSATWVGASGGTITQNYKITAVTDAGEESVASAVAGAANAFPSSEWVSGDHIDVSWTAVTGAAEYNIYKESSGYFGLVGVSTTTSWRDDNFDPDTQLTPPEANNPFTGTNYPSNAAFHQQRLWFGGPDENPQTFYASQTANFENFNKSRPAKDDDSLEFTLASGKINQIKWLAPFGDLLIGTAGAEFQVTGASEGAITPVNIDAKPQSFWGSGDLNPLIVGNSILHVQRQGGKVRDLFYSLEKDGYAGNDLSVLANHLFDGYSIVSWAYQQSPDSVLWAVRNDGKLLAMTYLKEHEIWGWHVHETEGEFEWVAVIGGDIEDRVYVSVKRTINGSDVRYIEKKMPKWRAADGVENAFYVDSGLTYKGAATSVISGLDHLEGQTVSVLADGSPIVGLVVSGGSITLPAEASLVHVGLPYTGALAPLPFEVDEQGGTSQGLIRGFGLVTLRLYETCGGKAGAGSSTADISDLEFDELIYEADNWGEAITPFTGIKELALPGGFGPDHTIFIVQDKPLPFNIQALIAEVDFG